MPTTIPAITALPDAPLRSDPSTFPAKAEDMLVAQETVFVPELNAFRTAVNTVGTEITALADDAADSAALATSNGAAQVALAAVQVALAEDQVDLAEAQVALATTQANAAASAALVAGATIWVSGTTYSIGDARYSPLNFQTYRRTTAGAGTTDPSLDNSNWTLATTTGVTQVTTATTNTTLTNTKTLLKITPASYGVTVKLADATTCSAGGPQYIIDNRGAYPVRVEDNTGVLKGFVFAGVVSYISLDNNSTAAGVWAISNNELVGASAQLLTTNMTTVVACVAIDSNRELLLGVGSGSNPYAVVYDKSTNTFGTPTLVRTMGGGLIAGAVLSAANQVLVVTSFATAFEAVTLSISSTTITVNTAATATLSANISAFADGCGLIAVGSSFVTSYTVATPAAQIRALSISGTMVTIGSATVLDGTAGGIQHASGSVVVVASTSNAVANVFTKPYTVSGSTLSAGTGTSTAKQNSSHTLQFFAPFSSGRWMIACGSSGNGADAGVVTLTGTTTTISYLTNFYAGGQTHTDAIIVGADKVLFLGNATSSNANILTDTAGTASKGTAISLQQFTAVGVPLYANGTDVYCGGFMNTSALACIQKVSCSGASPVLSATVQPGLSTGNFPGGFETASNAVLRKRASKVVSGNACHFLTPGTPTSGSIPSNRFSFSDLSFTNRTGSTISTSFVAPASTMFYRGSVESQAWFADGSTVITKLECVI